MIRQSRLSKVERLKALELKNKDQYIDNVMISILELNTIGEIAIVDSKPFFTKNMQQAAKTN